MLAAVETTLAFLLIVGCMLRPLLLTKES